MSMGTPSAEQAALLDPRGGMTQFVDEDVRGSTTPSFMASPARKPASRASSRGPPPKAHQGGSRSPSPSKMAKSPAATIAEEFPVPTGGPTIIVPPTPENQDVEFAAEIDDIIDDFEKRDADRNAMVDELRNQVQALTESKGELDLWAATAQSGRKRGREEIEAGQEMPELSGVVRTTTSKGVRTEPTQTGSSSDGQKNTGGQEGGNGEVSNQGGEDARQRHAREMGFTGSKRKSRFNPEDPDDEDDGDDDDEDDSDDGMSSDSDKGASSGSNGGRTGDRKKKKKKKKIRMLKDKQLSPPEPYDSSASTAAYRKWRERFRALISAQGDGIPWDKLLNFLEKRREKIVSTDAIDKIKKKYGFKSRHIKVIQSNLYHMLQQYTKGATSERVILATREMAMDQYRMLYFEGMHVTQQALFLAKGRVWRVQEAKRAADFSAAVDEWEQDREFLQRHTDYVMCTSDQQYALFNICPTELKKEILKDYDFKKFPTYLALKQHILNLITRDRDLQIHTSKGVHEVSKKDKKDKVKADEWWPAGLYGQADQGYEGQESTEDDEAEADWSYVGALKGTSKGKGKGKPGKGGGPTLFDGVPIISKS